MMTKSPAYSRRGEQMSPSMGLSLLETIFYGCLNLIKQLTKQVGAHGAALFDANGASEGFGKPGLGVHSGCVGVIHIYRWT